MLMIALSHYTVALLDVTSWGSAAVIIPAICIGVSNYLVHSYTIFAKKKKVGAVLLFLFEYNKPLCSIEWDFYTDLALEYINVYLFVLERRSACFHLQASTTIANMYMLKNIGIYLHSNRCQKH